MSQGQETMEDKKITGQPTQCSLGPTMSLLSASIPPNDPLHIKCKETVSRNLVMRDMYINTGMQETKMVSLLEEQEMLVTETLEYLAAYKSVLVLLPPNYQRNNMCHSWSMILREVMANPTPEILARARFVACAPPLYISAFRLTCSFSLALSGSSCPSTVTPQT